MRISGSLQEQTREDEETINTSSVVISPVRNTFPPRKILLIRNTSESENAVISVSFGEKSAVNGRGIVLQKNESFSDSSSDGYEAYQGQINAICSQDGGKVAIFER